MASLLNIGINSEKPKIENVGISPATRMLSHLNNGLNKASPNETYWFAHGNDDSASKTVPSDSKAAGNSREEQIQRDKEERLRQFRSQQEEGRLKKLRDLEHQFLQAQKLREQHEEERRRRIEEARYKESERRQLVEERKRQIWEAEQERKEAILRRNMEREARIEARRNAQRNQQSFAFGSSTPRTFDLDFPAIGVGRNSVLMSSVSGRRSEERDVAPTRSTSSCSLDRKTENLGCDNSFHSDSSNHTQSSSTEPAPSYLYKQIALQNKSSDVMKACLTTIDSLTQLPNFSNFPCPGWLVGSGVSFGEDLMTRSMISLSSSSSYRGRRRTDITPTLTPRERSITPNSGRRGKDHSRSPSRPHSSMSGTSDVSMTTSSSMSAVNMRPRPPPRRPRPFSIHGALSSSASVKKEPDSLEKNGSRDSQLLPVSTNVKKPPRAKSATRESSETKTAQAPVVSNKPIPPPKSSQVIARAKSNPVPIKDNLRKVAKHTSNKSTSLNSKNPAIDAAKPALSEHNVFQDEKGLQADSRDVVTPDNVTNSSLASPISDSEMLVSIGSSVAESSVQISESSANPTNHAEDSAAENSKSLRVSEDEKDVGVKPQKETVAEDIPKQKQETAIVNGTENETAVKDATPKLRITSEEEARAALAEKRRLAREQAEKEAELERQRLEEIKRLEDEQRRKEEEAQRLLEEEQVRLAELHRLLEQEKLQKAIQEQQQREKEEQARKDEEAKQKAEREEQEKKAREETERQRIELEDKLRKEEEERAERKRRVEQIMARTRGKAGQSPSGSQSEIMAKMSKSVGATSSNPNPLDDLIEIEAPGSKTSVTITNGIKTDASLTTSPNSSNEASMPNLVSWSESNMSGPLPDILNSENNTSNNNGLSMSGNVSSERTLSASVAVSPHTNGYSSQEEMSCTTSPEYNAEMDLLVDIQGIQQKSTHACKEQDVDLTKLVEVDPLSLDNSSNKKNFLMDDVNSNLLDSTNPFAGSEDDQQKKQDTPFTDLLS